MNACTVSAPGRLCLFGEHQDYLHLPVIAAAISLRLTVTGRRTGGHEFIIHRPDLGDSIRFSIREAIRYSAPHDYIRSGLLVLQRHGYAFAHGLECTISSTIPIRAGTSSSSALSVGWIRFLAQFGGREASLSPDQLARYAYEAEVEEFNEAGGMMDQYTSALGGILAIDFHPEFRIECLDVPLKSFVLGDSRQPKDTQTILRRVKDAVLDIVNRLQQQYPEFSLVKLSLSDLEKYKRGLTPQEVELLEGTVRNHELTRQARSVLSSRPFDARRFGQFLTEHHCILRDVQQISTPKIDRMLEAALNAGACGGKINGSGGGGCMFAYAPDCAEQVAEAIERAGGVAFIVHVDEGCRVESISEL